MKEALCWVHQLQIRVMMAVFLQMTLKPPEAKQQAGKNRDGPVCGGDCDVSDDLVESLTPAFSPYSERTLGPPVSCLVMDWKLCAPICASGVEDTTLGVFKVYGEFFCFHRDHWHLSVLPESSIMHLSQPTNIGFWCFPPKFSVSRE